MLCVIDLYAGAGGLSIGAARAGFKVVSALELDKTAILSHTINFPETKHICCDIMNVDGDYIVQKTGIRKEDISGIIGGPPCQGFSTMGYGRVDDERNSLFVKFFKTVWEIKPLFFVAENVPGIMNKKYKSIREKAFKYVEDYTLCPTLKIDASKYGAATNRTRCFFIGFRKDLKIKISETDFYNSAVCNSDMTNVEQALEGLPFNIKYNKHQKGVRQLLPSYFNVNEHLQSDYFYYRITDMIPEGVGNPEFIKTYQENHITNGFYATKHTQDVKRRFKKLKYGELDSISRARRLNPDGFCPTLRAGTGPDKGSYQAVRPIHYRAARVITPREAARLQGFPDWYMLPDTIWHSFRQIGNSVSPFVSESIMKVIFTYLNGTGLSLTNY